MSSLLSRYIYVCILYIIYYMYNIKVTIIIVDENILLKWSLKSLEFVWVSRFPYSVELYLYKYEYLPNAI